MINLRPAILLICAIVALYVFNQPWVVSAVSSFQERWNIAVEYVLYFKDKEPYVFMALPIIAVYLLGKK